jgi:predicted DNA-binding transcriptional regulator AlpA
MLGVVHHLVGAQEIGRMLGVNRQRVHQLAAHPDFPAPIVTLGVGRVWQRKDIEAWAKAKGRTLSTGLASDDC